MYYEGLWDYSTNHTEFGAHSIFVMAIDRYFYMHYGQGDDQPIRASHISCLPFLH